MFVINDLLKDKKLLIPEELLRKISTDNSNFEWEINEEGNLELKPIPKECVKLAKRLDDAREELNSGNYINGDVNTLAKRYGL